MTTTSRAGSTTRCSIYATAGEQQVFLAGAGFRDLTTLDAVETLYVLAARR